MTGVFDGKLRVANTYRTQWSGLGKGYNTIHLSGDVPVGKTLMSHNNFFGLGFQLGEFAVTLDGRALGGRPRCRRLHRHGRGDRVGREVPETQQPWTTYDDGGHLCARRLR